MVVPKKGTRALLVASFPAGSECELQESVAAVAGCACCERGCWFTHAAFGFVLSLRVCVGVSRRLREPACGVAFTGAGLWSAEPMLVCRVVPLVELCDTCLWLLPALGWLVANSSEVLPESFSIGSGGGERCPLVEVHRLAAVFWWCFPELFVVVLSVTVALPSRLRCIAWLPCVLVRFSKTVGCCPGEVRSQDCSGLVSAGCCATSGLRVVVLCHGLGAVLRTVATFVAKVPPLLSCFEVELVAPLMRFVSLWHDGLW
ncbi:hypothetical protein Taro_046137 [Colocasia esculenta]|uniref:Uncharacterized protein n=1 Tax=Colocasia esculenta TaxID=4460 RepID=A0A843X5Q8_COLES|nr:hypothetical protein [Colocasia esculenta]